MRWVMSYADLEDTKTSRLNGAKLPTAKVISFILLLLIDRIERNVRKGGGGYRGCLGRCSVNQMRKDSVIGGR